MQKQIQKTNNTNIMRKTKIKTNGKYIKCKNDENKIMQIDSPSHSDKKNHASKIETSNCTKTLMFNNLFFPLRTA